MSNLTILDSGDTLESSKSLLPLLNARETNEQHTYLSARYCGFSHIEACQLAKVSQDKPHVWRKSDPIFANYERKITNKDFRESVRKDTLSNLYYRNAFLALKKDMEVLAKANGLLDIDYTEIDPSTGEHITKHGCPPMTSFDKSYLLQIRKEYSPSQMVTLEKILAGEVEGFNITQFILNINK